MSVKTEGLFAGRWSVSSRQVFWLGFYGIVLSAWIALYAMAVPAALPAGYDWSALCLTAGETTFRVLFGMWALMSAAMMTPTFVPAVRVFGDLAGVRASNSASMASLVAGYVGVWLAFSAMAAQAQAVLGGWGLLWPDGASRQPWFTAALLALAGLYQLSLVKSACLAKCRHPLVFFMQHWKPGNRAAFAMGLRLGAFCVGCCWALMLLGFIGGTMNILWMGMATLFMIFEKLPGVGERLTRPTGIILLISAVVVLSLALSSWDW
ncbi:MAG: DUF2182 domain-containing protein [Alphaproteobacteria bacterium]|nr:DUF2182 domain-containing protein [Alphaproteobacteria bacterium]